MTPLNQKAKQYTFAAARKKASSSPKTATTQRKYRKTYPASSGMMSAAGNGPQEATVVTKRKRSKPKKDVKIKEIPVVPIETHSEQSNSPTPVLNQKRKWNLFKRTTTTNVNSETTSQNLKDKVKNYFFRSEKNKCSPFENTCKELNKYGSIALGGLTIANHATITHYKLDAAQRGDEDDHRKYTEKGNNYIKPHFSLPSDWYHARMTFGTPWYF